MCFMVVLFQIDYFCLDTAGFCIDIDFRHDAEHGDGTGTNFTSAVCIDFLRGFMNVTAKRKVDFFLPHQFQDIFLTDEGVTQTQKGVFFDHGIVRKQNSWCGLGTIAEFLNKSRIFFCHKTP